ncbi:dihydroorotase [Sulfurovum lithotrophicum]|uniref:Dihydroorotase n=1 Tax=Sulfurovum lithotrophicum TaxID=206403 RepID=A0A7U4RR96_9BACT|nr:dihydroorotase [Sulfurovum lithotrophicum]AKF25536.1 dihydroorotase [Sulfurovum lithotrophicum]
MPSTTVRLDAPLDMHLHLRDGEMLNNIAKESAQTFSGAVVMPNLVPPVSSKAEIVAYRERIMKAIGEESFIPYMTLFFKPEYDRVFLESLREDLTSIKLYPAGITTNSEGGVSGFDVEELRPTLEAMSDLNIPLCIHGETNGFVMDREAQFVPIYEKLATAFPKLKIIMEHITTKESVEALERFDNLYATITLHHLLITLDDVAGGMLQPHLFCKPIAKRPEDREALLNIALKAHPKVMFGSDSAPHPKHAKEACGCAAGVFTAPIALQVLTELFETHNSLDNLQAFISGNARQVYGITPLKKQVILEKKPFTVPADYKGVVPMYAGERLAYSIREVKHG